MKDLVKRYLPYALVIFGVFLIVPLFFANEALENFFAIALYFIFLVTTVVCSAIYCSKHGLDFLFALIAPIAFLFTMIIYCGGFTKLTNIILLVVYLVAGIFGLFLGDLAFGDERRKREQKEKREAEKLMLQANRRDASERERMQREVKKAPSARKKSPTRTASADKINKKRPSADVDDFDYDKYLADIDKKSSNDDEVDKILNDWHS